MCEVEEIEVYSGWPWWTITLVHLAVLGPVAWYQFLQAENPTFWGVMSALGLPFFIYGVSAPLFKRIAASEEGLERRWVFDFFGFRLWERVAKKMMWSEVSTVRDHDKRHGIEKQNPTVEFVGVEPGDPILLPLHYVNAEKVLKTALRQIPKSRVSDEAKKLGFELEGSSKDAV